MDFRKYIIPAILFFCTFLTYLHNLSHSVYGGDVGDLVTAAFVGGVAHPPGYPLFTLIGFLLTRLHFLYPPAYAMGLISVFSGAAGILLFFLTVRMLTKSTVISLVSSFILAFSYFFWFYNEIAEVFSLNNFFFILLMYLIVRISQTKSINLLPLFCFTLGLSLTNHQTIVLTVPSLFLLLAPLLWKSFKKKQLTIKTVLFCIIAGILGFSVYGYVFIASSHHPILNWDNVKDIPSLLHLILRKDYGTFSAGEFAVQPSLLQRFVIAKTYLAQLLFQLTIPVIVCSILGLFYLLKKKRLLAGSLLLGFILTGPLFIGYAGFPLTGNFYFGVNERFFILSTIFLLYFFPFGLVLLTTLFKKITRISPVALQAVFFIIPIMLFTLNFPKTDLSQVYVGDTYAEDLLQSLPKNSIVFLAGDTIIFNVWYANYTLGVRPDVHVLNIAGNIGSPYYKTLLTNYKKKHPSASEKQAVIGMVNNLPTNGTVFSVESLDFSNDKLKDWIPYGLVLQLIRKDAMPTEEMYTHTTDAVWSHMHIPDAAHETLATRNLTIADIPNSYANAMLLTGNFYLSQYHDVKKAKAWYDRAAKAVPTYDKTFSSLAVWYLANGDCSNAAANAQKSLALNPLGGINYFILYSTYHDCAHDQIKAQSTAEAFEKQFQIPFVKSYSTFSNNKTSL